MGKSNTAMVVRGEHFVPPGSNLAKKERLLLEAMTEFGEAFFKTGMILSSIYTEEDWRDGGYTNFRHYCRDRQPCGIKSTQASQLMAAARIRPLLPDLSRNNEITPRDLLWNEYNVRPLTHKDFTPRDVKRIGKKLLTLAKREKKLTALMVKAMCDDERGVVRKKRKKIRKALRENSLAANLERCVKNLQEFRVHFGLYESDAWDEVGETNPQLVKSLIREIDLFASFCKE